MQGSQLPGCGVLVQETLDIWAPLANRVGLWNMKAPLEDLAFKQLQPAEYADLRDRLEAQQRPETLVWLVDRLRAELDKEGIRYVAWFRGSGGNKEGGEAFPGGSFLGGAQRGNSIWWLLVPRANGQCARAGSLASSGCCGSFQQGTGLCTRVTTLRKARIQAHASYLASPRLRPVAAQVH